MAADAPYASPSLPGVRLEVERLEALVEPHARVRLLTGATLSDLAHVLAEYQPHVFHYAGHAAVRDSGDRLLQLSFSTQDKHFDILPSSFANALREVPDLRLMFLSAESTDMIAAVAAETIPAVIGMRGLITDRTSMMFATEFYRRVFDGILVEEAASDARRRINYQSPGSVEWSVPVLYLRSGATLLPSDSGREVTSVSLDDVTSGVVAADPGRQAELDYLGKKLAVTKTNLEELQLKKKQMGEAVPSVVTSQIMKLEYELSETSRQISELRL